MPRHNFINLTGLRFGRWTVLAQDETRKYNLDQTKSRQTKRKTHTAILWLCQCDCGKQASVIGSGLRNGSSTSCGCYRNEEAAKQETTHGQTRTRQRKTGTWLGSPEYEMFRGAKQQSKKYNLPIDLKLSDIVIPETCPVFGTRFVQGTGGKPRPESPSLDRIIPHKGYVKNNVCVISYRANELKRNGTIAEFKQIITYMENKQK